MLNVGFLMTRLIYLKLFFFKHGAETEISQLEVTHFMIKQQFSDQIVGLTLKEDSM